VRQQPQEERIHHRVREREGGDEGSQESIWMGKLLCNPEGGNVTKMWWMEQKERTPTGARWRGNESGKRDLKKVEGELVATRKEGPPSNEQGSQTRTVAEWKHGKYKGVKRQPEKKRKATLNSCYTEHEEEIAVPSKRKG